MSIADKLTTIAQNQQRVYDAGKQAEYDRFWDAYQANGSRVDYTHAFAGAGWTEETFRPKYNMGNISSAYMMFRYSPMKIDLAECLERLGITLNFAYCTNFQYTFFGCAVTRAGVVDTSGATVGLTQTFSGSGNLKTIDKIISLDKTIYDGTFNNLPALENIAFEGVIARNISIPNSPKLTKDSVQSIIDHLKDLTGGAAQTLTFHATVGGQLTEVQKATITAKNWTLVY